MICLEKPLNNIDFYKKRVVLQLSFIFSVICILIDKKLYLKYNYNVSILENKQKGRGRKAMELTQCINYLLTTAQHAVFQYLSMKLSDYDVTPSQYGVLSCLWDKGYATPKQIAETLCLETSTISGVLDRMQKKKLIERVVNKEDRREVRVVITKKGKMLKEPIQEIIEEVNREVLKNYTEEQITVLKDNLRAIASTKYY